MRKKQKRQEPASAESDSKSIRKKSADVLLPTVEKSLPELQVHQVELEILNEELLQSRDLLEESRDRYVDFYDFSPVAYLTLSHKALIVEINLTGASMLGEEPEQLRRRRFAEFVAAEDNELWHRHFMAVRQQGGKLSCELRIQLGDGSRSHVQIDSLLREREGHEPLVRIALTDITELKRTEAALRENEKQLRLLEQRAIVQTSLDGFLVVDARSTRIVEVNNAYCHLMGYAREELLTLSISDLDANESPDETAAHIRKITADGYDRFETRHRHKRGHLLDIEVSVSCFELDGGVHLVFARDITERKHAEQQLHELAAHIQTVREEEKARLAREIHDDLGSTLAALKLRLSHLLEFEVSADMKKMPLFTRLESMLQILESAITSTRRIITDMRPDVLDNLGLLAALKWQAERFQNHSGIECQVVCASNRSCVDCKDCEYPPDKTQSINLFRIFQEALNNVARHSGASKVTVEYRPGNEFMVLSICDNGRGLPEGDSPASTSFGIRGMHERISQLRGQIKFENLPDGGLCLTVQLPFVADNKGLRQA